MINRAKQTMTEIPPIIIFVFKDSVSSYSGEAYT